MPLREYGWDDSLAAAFDKLERTGLVPGRVLLSSGNFSRVITEAGELQATLSGRMRHHADTVADIPTVGDWIAVRCRDDGTSRVEHIFPRRSKLSRRAAGKRGDEQVVAANVDTVFIVMGLDGDYNIRRLERLLTMVRESGARPVVLLNKIDICEDAQARFSEVTEVAGDTLVLLTSCKEGQGVDEALAQIRPRETAVLIGSSGAGKSTFINRLLGEAVQKTRNVRDGDDRGRHTTSHRELFMLPDGGLLIDSPGIREVQLWSSKDSLALAFDDIATLAEECRFRDCGHESEAGCAVLEAVESGTLDNGRLSSYHDLQKEVRDLELRQDESAQRIQKKKWRGIHKEMKRSGKHRRR